MATPFPVDPQVIETLHVETMRLKASAVSVRSHAADKSPVADGLDVVIAALTSAVESARKTTALARKAVAEDRKFQIEAEIAAYDAESKRE